MANVTSNPATSTTNTATSSPNALTPAAANVGTTSAPTTATTSVTSSTATITTAKAADSAVENRTELEENVIKQTRKMIGQLNRFKESYASNVSIPVHMMKIFHNMMERCYIEINYLRQSNFLDPRQMELRLKVDAKLDSLRKDIEKLKKITNDIKLLNSNKEDHVCRDIRNFYTQVGRR